MTPEEALVLVDNLIEPERLNAVQELVLHQCWLGQTYQEIAVNSGYDADYIRVVGSRLWQTLSDISGEKITKVIINQYGIIFSDFFSQLKIILKYY